MKKGFIVIAAMAVVALAVAACGGGGGDPTGTSAPTATSVPVAPTATSAPDLPSPTPSATQTPAPVATATTAPTAVPEPATLEIRVTDAPPEGVTKILITAVNIEVNNAGGETESGWRTVLDGPISFDLVELTGVEGVLGDVVLPPGRYNQLRLEVVEALITIRGEEVNATVPSGTLRFTGGFDLVAGETTVITMDFDAAKSVVIRGRMDPLLKPGREAARPQGRRGAGRGQADR